MGKSTDCPDEGWSEAGAAWLDRQTIEDATDLFWIMEHGPDNEKDEATLERLLEDYQQAIAQEDEAAGDDGDGCDDDDCEGEAISVWDAADIYFDGGLDEDRMFGYSHEELTDAHESGG